MIPPVINVDFDFQFLERNFVARLVQASTARCRPEHRKLRRAQADLAFLAGDAASDFESQGRRASFFSQTHVPSAAFIREIPLRQPEMPRPQNFHRQVFDQKLSFDLARGTVMGTAHSIHSNVSCAARQDFIREKIATDKDAAVAE